MCKNRNQNQLITSPRTTDGSSPLSKPQPAPGETLRAITHLQPGAFQRGVYLSLLKQPQFVAVDQVFAALRLADQVVEVEIRDTPV